MSKRSCFVIFGTWGIACTMGIWLGSSSSSTESASGVQKERDGVDSYSISRTHVEQSSELQMFARIRGDIVDGKYSEAFALLQQMDRANLAATLMYEQLFAAWAKADPETTATVLTSLKEDRQKYEAGLRAFASVCIEYPEALRHLGESISSIQDHEQFLEALCFKPVGSAPEDMLHVVSSLLDKLPGKPNDNLQAESTRLVGLSWCKKNPKAAIEFANTMGTANGRLEIVSEALRTLTIMDPDEATRVLSGPLFGEEESQEYAGIVAAQWAESDPENAIRWVESLQPGNATLLSSMVDHVIEQNPHAIAKLASAMANDVPADVIKKISSTWMMIDPVEASSWLQEHAPLMDAVEARACFGKSGFLLSASSDAARAYVELFGDVYDQDPGAVKLAIKGLGDPIAAQQWASTLENPTLKELAEMTIIASGHDESYGQAISALKAFPESGDRLHLIRSVAIRWALEDPHQVYGWLAGESDNLRAALLPSVINTSLNDGDLDVVTPLAISALGDLPSSSNNVAALKDLPSILGQSMVENSLDPVSAVNLANNIEASNEKDALLAAISASWTHLDPISASEWIAQVESGPIRDVIVRDLINSIPDDPERALQWASTIEDSQNRKEITEAVFSAWLRKDADGARAFVEQMPPSQQDYLEELP